MSEELTCPKCGCDYPYEDSGLMICPDCGHEWDPNKEEEADDNVVKDAHGNTLADGDTVTLIKDLKVKGSSQAIKVGTRVKNIRLIPDAADGHNIDCKIDGFGAMKLKSEFVKK